MRPLKRFPDSRHACVFGIALFLAGGLQAASPVEILQADTRSSLDLKGEWDVLPIEGIQFIFPPPQAGWIKEKVPASSSEVLKADGSPYTSPVSGFLTKDKTALIPMKGYAAWFKRSFDLPSAVPAGQRARLDFEGMAFKSEVWLNGKKLGGSLLGLVPSSYDVTEIVHAGANELVIGLAGRPALLDVAKQTYLAPASGVGAGIWGQVKLEFLPDLHVENVFVNTSVKDKRMRMDVHVKNDSKTLRKFTIDSLIVDSRQTPQTQIKSPEVLLAPGEARKVTLGKDWIAPYLWSPTSPALYFANISLREGPAVKDRKTLRFGFREFEIRGRDFFLNGIRTTLLRNSNLVGLYKSREEIFSGVRRQAGNPYNVIRLHIGFNSKALLDICDEIGLMTIPESSWYTIGPAFSLAASDLWLPNVEAYLRQFMEENFNHPSVVMWNMTNETFWGGTDEAAMRVADRLVKVAREVDPVRPLDGDAEVSWGGRLPVINIHYPESSVGNSLRSKYPNSATVFPNDWFWLSRDQENVSWRATFKWDRPLIIGEYWFPDGEADRLSSFMGESIYDWQKWRYQRLEGSDNEDFNDNEYVKSQKGIADAYRIQGVAGLNPWCTDGRKAMPPVALRPLDFFPNFFGGTTASRKFVIFNDSGHSYDTPRLQCRLVTDGRTLWEKSTPVTVTPGEIKQVEVAIDCPQVTEPVTATLTVRLVYNLNGTQLQISRYEDTVFLLPRPNLSDVDVSKIRLVEKGDATAKALAKMGLKLTPSAELSAKDLDGVKVVIIGEETDASGGSELLKSFAEQGGVVVVLRQTEWTPLVPELPDIDKEHVSTRSWRRTFDHPVTAGMDDRQFSYWRPDHLVSERTFRKPATGTFRCLLDAGGLYGLRWSPLVEVPFGQGDFLLTSLDLVAKSEVEPAAAQLLNNLVRYAVAFQPRLVEPLRLLVGDNLPLRSTLAAAGVVFTEGLTGRGPVLLDASFKPSKAQLEEMGKYLQAGGSVWLHGFGSSNVAEVASLFPFNPILKPYDPSVQAAVRRSEDPWMNNLSSFDFFWTKVQMLSGPDYFSKGQPTAALGGEVLQLPTVQAGKPLIEPGLLVKVPSGKGQILFDTLAWDKALGFESDKVTRITASLAANLGAEVRITADRTQYEYSTVNLGPYANMGYVDSVADDGKGGWMDGGANDMRFFLINQLGRGGGLETAPEVETQPFPEKVTLADRPFWLLDARKTKDRSVISLRGQMHGEKLPSSVKGIKVGSKADALWFLQAAGWAAPVDQQVVARYVIHYADGSQEEFPIRYGIEVSEWWSPAPLPKARVAWTGHNLKQSPIGIYMTEWNNPFPDKEIASIDVIGDLSPTQFVLMGITAGVVKGGTKGELLSKWKLEDFDGSQVPNLVDDGAPLSIGSAPPTPVTDGALKGLHFEAGQSLHVKLRSLPRMGGLGEENQPFALGVVLSPSGPPPGAYGGIFEAMRWQQSGFRMVLDQALKIGVEVFCGDGKSYGLSSSRPLELGRTYKVELRFDGNYATLMINDKPDTVKEMPRPAAFQGDAQIGRASGLDYFFNGTISEITLTALTP